MKNKKKRKPPKQQPKKTFAAAAAADSRSEKKFSQNFWASTGMTQSFLALSASSAESAISPTKKVGFPFMETFVSFF